MKNKIFKYKIEKKDNEIELYFSIRKNFIESLKPKNIKELKLLNMYSNILLNMLFLKCKYEIKTEKKIMSFLKKLKKTLFFRNISNNIINSS
jgi:hypothetical protein